MAFTANSARDHSRAALYARLNSVLTVPAGISNLFIAYPWTIIFLYVAFYVLRQLCRYSYRSRRPSVFYRHELKIMNWRVGKLLAMVATSNPNAAGKEEKAFLHSLLTE